MCPETVSRLGSAQALLNSDLSSHGRVPRTGCDLAPVKSAFWSDGPPGGARSRTGAMGYQRLTRE